MLLGLLGYAWQNDSGHTGADPYDVFRPFVALGICGFALLWSSTSRFAAGLLLVVSIFGAGFPWLLDRTNILQNYTAWIQEDMPRPPANPEFTLIAYLGATVVGTLAWVALRSRRRRRLARHEPTG